MDLIYLLLFITGLFFGSFYNVVALRISEGKSIIFPGSHCVNCNHRLNWYELIPVFSYFFLGGKCLKCKSKISIQYPLIELLTGLLFAISYHAFGFTYYTLLSLVVVSLVIITIVTDLKYMVILDEVLIPSGILIIILLFLIGGSNFLINRIVSGVILFLIMLVIKILGDFSFKQESLGWGDVKLSLIAGLVLGVKLGVVYIFVGAFIALPYAIYTSLRHNNSMIPFGPFLVISLLLIFWNTGLITNILNILLGV